MPKTAHHPEILSNSPRHNQCNCSCGWQSPTRRTLIGIHIAYARHLAQAVTTRDDPA